MNKKELLIIISIIILMLFLASVPAFALTAEEVEQQVTEQGKEIATGNVLVWFLCAVSFLKVSQKVDSFMSSLGVNVGKTGGSMLAEAMVASRAITGGLGNLSGMRGGGFRNPNTASQNPLSGGLAGTVGRMFTESAADNVTGKKESVPSEMARGMYENSIKTGGNFATSVISKVATGNIAQNGVIKGTEATEAFQHYMGLNQNTDVGNISDADNANSSTYTEPFDELGMQDNEILPYMGDFTGNSESDDGTEYMESYSGMPIADNMNADSDLPNQLESGYQLMPNREDATLSDNSNVIHTNIANSQNAQDKSILSTGTVNDSIQQSVTAGREMEDSTMQQSIIAGGEMAGSTVQQSITVGGETEDISMQQNMISGGEVLETSIQQSSISGDGTDLLGVHQEIASGVEIRESENMMNGTQTVPSDTAWLPDSPSVNEAQATSEYTHTGTYPSVDSGRDVQMESIHTSGGNMPYGSEFSENRQQEQVTTSSITQTASTLQGISAINSFKDMEIGGGRITGTEISKQNPNGIRFAMYHADQYALPEDKFSVVKAVDGSKWYHQYAKNVVVKEPYMDNDGKIRYDESLQKKLPPSPKRKDRM